MFLRRFRKTARAYNLDLAGALGNIPFYCMDHLRFRQRLFPVLHLSAHATAHIVRSSRAADMLGIVLLGGPSLFLQPLGISHLIHLAGLF